MHRKLCLHLQLLIHSMNKEPVWDLEICCPFGSAIFHWEALRTAFNSIQPWAVNLNAEGQRLNLSSKRKFDDELANSSGLSASGKKCQSRELSFYMWCVMQSSCSVMTLSMIKWGTKSEEHSKTLEVFWITVVMRWDIWLSPAGYHTENLLEVKQVVKSLESNGIFVKWAKKAINDSMMQNCLQDVWGLERIAHNPPKMEPAKCSIFELSLLFLSCSFNLQWWLLLRTGSQTSQWKEASCSHQEENDEKVWRWALSWNSRYQISMQPCKITSQPAPSLNDHFPYWRNLSPKIALQNCILTLEERRPIIWPFSIFNRLPIFLPLINELRFL